MPLRRSFIAPSTDDVLASMNLSKSGRAPVRSSSCGRENSSRRGGNAAPGPLVRRNSSRSRLPTRDPAEQVALYNPMFMRMVLSGDATIVPPLRVPRKGDWLDEHQEKGQSLRQFTQSNFKATPHGSYTTIVLVGLGNSISPSLLSQLKEYLAAFYQLSVVVEGPVDIEPFIADKTIGTVINSFTQNRQLVAGDCQRFVAAIATKKHARHMCACIGVTLDDLTKDEKWNFVYGQASLVDGHGIFSLYRFSPEFNGEAPPPKPYTADDVILTRGCKVMAHELGHIFGLKHCISFTCLMNGANHVDELNLQRMLECPACTQKLTSSIGWDLRKRYSDLLVVTEHLKLVENVGDDLNALASWLEPDAEGQHPNKQEDAVHQGSSSAL